MKPETIIGISATIIALASLALSVWEGMQTREHNRLTVRPRLMVTNNLVEGDPEFGILVSNKGTGPAIVRKLEIYVDNKRVDPDEYGGWGNARVQLGINAPWNHCSGFDDMAVSAGETVPLLAIKAGAYQTRDNELLLRNAIKRLNVVINYESIYGEKYSTDARVP